MNKYFKLLSLLFIMITLFCFKSNKVLAYENNIKASISIPLLDNCENIFGSTTYNSSPDAVQSPAYWMNWAFKIMKYIAIVAVVILSTMDFIKAIVSQDNDALKKATKTALQRFIFAVIIFFLPILVNVVLSLFGVSGCTFGK